MTKKLTLREIQLLELDMLKAVVEFCDRHQLTYVLCGGTLLGAIRHQGFIPWDDDIDLLMPREDYEKFLALHAIFEEEFPFTVASNRLNNLKRPYCRILNKRTICNRQFIDDMEENFLWIDIFPLDGLPSNKQKVQSYLNQMGRLNKLLVIALSRTGEGKSKIKKLVKPVVKSLLNIVGVKRLVNHTDKMCQRYTIADSDFVGENIMARKAQEMMPKEAFLTTVNVNFEGLTVKSPSNWDYYLEKKYGNYMQLPPESEQVNHTADIYLVED